MKCDNCNKTATVHLTEIKAGKKIEKHLCEQCAAQNEGVPVKSHMPINELLTNFVMLELILTRSDERPIIAAAQGLDAAKDVAGDVYDRTARQAEAEGLTPDALGNAAEDIGQRVRRVAESAVTTAFEPQNSPRQNTNGVRDHG